MSSDESMESDYDEKPSTSTNYRSQPSQNGTKKSSQRKIIHTGKITTIELSNFLTHSQVIVHPSEHVNIVIGPNGTGKSSIVTAIIIGMGGSTKIVSQRNRLSDYVKNGKDVAKVTITLYRDENRRTVRFSREFGRDNKSKFTIDGKSVTEKIYLENINDLNVQVDNLCQFLPQERVQDFAKQNPQELFQSTQMSVCSDEMLEIFDELKDLRNTQLNGEKRLKKNRTDLLEHQKRVELLQPSVDDIRRQDEMTKRIELLKMRIKWLEFEQLYTKCQEIDKEMNAAKKQHSEATKQKSLLTKNVANIAKNRQRYEQAVETEKIPKVKSSNDLQRINGQIEVAQRAINKAKGDLDAQKEAANELVNKIDESRMSLNTFQEELENYLVEIGSVDQVNENVQQIGDEIIEMKANVEKFAAMRAKLVKEINEVVTPNLEIVNNKLQSFQSVANAKLELIRKSKPDTYAAVMWLRNNQDRFRSKIYEPITMVLNVRSNDYSKYVENCISERDLIAFTCEDADDMSSFIEELRVNQKLNVNAIHSEAATSVRFKSTVPLRDVRRFGGEIYMIDCIEAPAPILNYLCKNNRFHDVLIGNQNLEYKCDDLPNAISLVFTPTRRIQIKKSKYSGQKIVMSSAFKSKNLLNVQISKQDEQQAQNQKEELVRQKDRLNNQRQQIELQIGTAEKALQAKYKQKNEEAKRIHHLNDLKSKVKQQTNQLRRLESQTIDLNEETEKFNQIASKKIKEIVKLNKNTLGIYDLYTKANLSENRARERLKIFRNSNASYDVQIMEADEALERAQTLCDRVGGILDTWKQRCKEKQVEAMALTNGKKPSDGNQFPFKQQFDEMSNDVEELGDELDDLETQANCRSNDDQRTLDEYEERLKSIKIVEKEISKSSRSHTDLERDMTKKHNKWYPKISEMIETINRNFGNFMSTMNCAGEVELIRASDHDYENYGIEIRVKYRSSEQLRPLDRFVQSGGERAVAIAVYSLSLQHLSQVPFRCVDEINQGMDPNNERRVFEMLVNIVARPEQSQIWRAMNTLRALPFSMDHTIMKATTLKHLLNTSSCAIVQLE